MPGRLQAVLQVIYLVFNEGYTASAGDALTQPDLSGEAIRLGRLLSETAAGAGGSGAAGAHAIARTRRAARVSPAGDIIVLEDQDRLRWDGTLIGEGVRLAQQALAAPPPGPYALQAAIAAVHSTAATFAATNWDAIHRPV